MALRKAMWTILASYNHDRTIFDEFHLPDGIEKPLVVNNILSELGELSIIYSRPDTLKAMIDVWSSKQLRVWTELWDTMNYEYNPIDNYDRKENWTDTETRDLAGTNNQVRDLSSTNHESRDLTNSNNQVRDLSTTSNETRNLKNTNNQVRDLATTNTETRNLKSTNNEVRDLANSLTEVRDLSGSNNEVRDLADQKQENYSNTSKETNSGKDVNMHEVWSFNDLEPHGANRDTTTYGHIIDNNGSGNDNYTINYSGTDNFTSRDTGTIDYDGTDTGSINRDMSDTGTVNHNSSDTGTINNSGTDNGTINNIGSDSGTINNSGTDRGTVNHNGTDTGTVDNRSTDTGTIQTVHEGHIHGNIGVTTTQKMIEEQRELVKFNVIDYIIEDFKKKFCLKIW